MQDDKARKNRIICFSTTTEMVDALRLLAPTRDSMSSLLREIITAYLNAHEQRLPATKK